MNTRALTAIGSLLALNAGLFVFNNLPLVPVRSSSVSVYRIARQARDAARDAREIARAARSQARIARHEMKSAMHSSHVCTGAVPVQTFDRLSRLKELEKLGDLDISVNVPAMPALAVMPPPAPVVSVPMSTSEICPRRVTLHQYFRDRMM